MQTHLPLPLLLIPCDTLSTTITTAIAATTTTGVETVTAVTRGRTLVEVVAVTTAVVARVDLRTTAVEDVVSILNGSKNFLGNNTLRLLLHALTHLIGLNPTLAQNNNNLVFLDQNPNLLLLLPLDQA